ncbi:MAG: methyltransferase domain-containing protein, partial [Candidatus Saccharimonas sp.]|nr:methyltransferase domain-containing protein [Planctomycetaceae bacterium]
MQSKLFRRAATAILVSLLAVGACAGPAKEPDKPAEVEPVTTQAATETAVAQPSTDVGTTAGDQRPGAQPRKVDVRVQAPKPTEQTAKTEKTEKTEEYTPQTGQEGKDVVWVPTPQPLVNKMLEMAKLTANDVLYDLGSGDGRTVITAAKRGATSTGVEFNPKMVALSERIAQREGVGGKAKFVQGDFFKTDFSKATVLTLFLMTDLNLKLRPLILDMKPGTRVVSNTFTMGDWKADQTETVGEKEGCTGYCTAHLWIVPAKVEGKWKLPAGELTLSQAYQTVSGTLGGNPISNATLHGDRVTFNAGNAQYA